MAKIKSFGVAVSVATNDIGGLDTPNLGGGDVNFIDMTTHDSSDNSKEFVGGLIDHGTLELSGKYDIADTGQSYLRSNPGVTAAVVVTFSDDSTASFSGVIGKYDISNPLDEDVSFTCPIKVSGTITYAAS